MLPWVYGLVKLLDIEYTRSLDRRVHTNNPKEIPMHPTRAILLTLALIMIFSTPVESQLLLPTRIASQPFGEVQIGPIHSSRTFQIQFAVCGTEGTCTGRQNPGLSGPSRPVHPKPTGSWTRSKNDATGIIAPSLYEMSTVKKAPSPVSTWREKLAANTNKTRPFFILSSNRE